MKTIIKTFFILLIFLTSQSAIGQWVTIPDPNFVAWLNANGYSGCMNGNQLNKQCNQVLNTTSINCSNSNISDISGVEHFVNLTNLNCGYNPIISINALPASLISLNCTNYTFNSLTDLPFSLPPNLRYLYLDLNNISWLPDPLPDSLRVLGCGSNPISTLPPLPSKLEWLTCSDTDIQSIPPLPSTLRHLEAEYMSNLNEIPALPDTLEGLWLDNTPALKCLPSLTYIENFGFNNSGFYCVPNYGTVLYSSPSLNSIPICNLVVDTCAMNFNISGQVYMDSNNSCSRDSLESLVSGVKVRLYQGSTLLGQNYSGLNGIYTLNTTLGNFQYNINEPHFPFDVICPISGFHNSSFTPADSMDTGKDFGLACKATPLVEIISGTKISGSFFPADTVIYKLKAGDVAQGFNITCASGISGIMKVWLENSPAQILGVFPAGSMIPVISGDTLIYTISDFGTTNPDSAFRFLIRVDSTATIADLVKVNAQLYVQSTSQSKQFIYPVTNSFDPNHKEVIPPDFLTVTSEPLLYTIQFQNTGNAPAQNIIITDTIDSDLDLSSFRLLDYSVRPSVSITGNSITFTFADINLPDSLTNEPESHGFVQFEISLKPNRPPGTIIENTANIYFDFNPPVITNTTVNTVVTPTSLHEHSDQHFSLSPNPASFETKISTSADGNYKVLIFDITGRIVHQDRFNGTQHTLQLSGLTKGLFVIELRNTSDEGYRKMLIVGD